MEKRYHIDGRPATERDARALVARERECGFEKAGDGLPEIRVDVFPPGRGGEAPLQYIWDWQAEKWAQWAPPEPARPAWQVNFDSPGVCG